MSNEKKISVIMSVYNEKEEWLKLAIESILNQNYRNLEFVIILDNPNNTLLRDLILAYCKIDNRIVFTENKNNLGLVQSLNKGLKFATGEYIARMDADDIAFPNRFEVQIEYILNYDYDLVATRSVYIDENGKEIARSGCYGKTPESCKKSLMYRNILLHPSWLAKKSVFEEVGNYSEVTTAEDYDFLCRCASKGYRLCNIDKVLMKYRIHDNSTTVSKAKQQYLVSHIVRDYYVDAITKKASYQSDRVLYEVNGLHDVCLDNRFNKLVADYKEAEKYIKEHRFIRGGFLLIDSLLRSKELRWQLYSTIMLKVYNR